MKQYFLAISIFVFVALGIGFAQQNNSTATTKAKPTATPPKVANVATASNANANLAVRPRIADTNANVVVVTNTNANVVAQAAAKTLTKEECDARVKKALADAKLDRRYPRHQHFTVFDDSKTATTDKMVKKPKEADTKIVTAPEKNADSKMVKTPKASVKTPAKITSTGKKPMVAKKISKPALKPAAKTSAKPAAKKPATVAKKESTPVKKPVEKPIAKKPVGKQPGKDTSNLDDKSDAKNPTNHPMPLELEFAADKSEITIGESVTLTTKVGGGTEHRLLTDGNGDKLTVTNGENTVSVKPDSVGQYSYRRILAEKDDSIAKSVTVYVVAAKTPEPPMPTNSVGAWFKGQWDAFLRLPGLISSPNVSPVDWLKLVFTNLFTYLILGTLILLFIAWRRRNRDPVDLSVTQTA